MSGRLTSLLSYFFLLLPLSPKTSSFSIDDAGVLETLYPMLKIVQENKGKQNVQITAKENKPTIKIILNSFHFFFYYLFI